MITEAITPWTHVKVDAARDEQAVEKVGFTPAVSPRNCGHGPRTAEARQSMKEAWLLGSGNGSDGVNLDSTGGLPRMSFVGYFEGLSCHRSIARRYADRRSLVELLGLGPDHETSDHSSISRTHSALSSRPSIAFQHCMHSEPAYATVFCGSRDVRVGDLVSKGSGKRQFGYSRRVSRLRNRR